MSTERVIIVGAGMAGLSAALECKARGIDFFVVEAGSKEGGRAKTITSPTGTAIDMGPHWQHGNAEGNTPLTALNDRYGIDGRNQDTVARVNSYDANGQPQGSRIRELVGEAFDPAKVEAAVAAGQDVAVSSLLKTSPADSEKLSIANPQTGSGRVLDTQTIMRYVSAAWGGVGPETPVSMMEFQNENVQPGGTQLKGGMGELLHAMAKDVGRENIRFNSPVARIVNDDKGSAIVLENGERIEGSGTIFTGSLAVLKSGRIAFAPPLSDDLQKDIAALNTANLAKITLEVDPSLFRQNRVEENTHIDLPTADPPVFCHLHGAGKPMVTLLIGGDAAKEIEGMSPSEAREFALRILKPVREVEGIENKIVGDPYVTGWTKDPYVGAAYSSAPPGTVRTGPRSEAEGRLIIAGDAFDDERPATMAGAHRSGTVAAAMAAQALEREQSRAQTQRQDTKIFFTDVGSPDPLPFQKGPGKKPGGKGGGRTTAR